MDKELYQKQYDFELEQKSALSSTINIPVVALTVLGGAISTLVLSFPFSSASNSTYFLLASVAAAVALSYATYCVFRSFLGYTYQKLPSIRELNEHLEELEHWHAGRGLSPEEAKEAANSDVDEFVLLRLSEAAEHNGVNNINRGAYLHKATAGVAFALVAVGCASALFVYEKVSAPAEVYQVRILGDIASTDKVNTMSDKNGGKTEKPAPKPAAPITKPKGPKNTEFRGDVTIPMPKAGTTTIKKDGGG